MTEQGEIDASQSIMKNNLETIIHSMPLNLKKQEDELVNRFARHTGNCLSKLKTLYEFMDELLEFVGKYTPCKKGCAYCCSIKVSISELEAQFIRKHEGVKPSKEKSVGDTHGSPCTFLKKGACSIYKSRPFVCRQHVSVSDSPRWCREDVCNDIIMTYPRFTEVRKVYDNLLEESGLGKRSDIRAIFPVRK